MEFYRHIGFEEIKVSVISYGIASTYVKKMWNSWSAQNRIIPQDWKDMTTAILEHDSYLQWQSWWKEEVKVIEQWNQDRGTDISQDQLLGEGQYADL